jgi:hypothetical protein
MDNTTIVATVANGKAGRPAKTVNFPSGEFILADVMKNNQVSEITARKSCNRALKQNQIKVVRMGRPAKIGRSYRIYATTV